MAAVSCPLLDVPTSWGRHYEQGDAKAKTTNETALRITSRERETYSGDPEDEEWTGHRQIRSLPSDKDSLLSAIVINSSWVEMGGKSTDESAGK